MAALAPSIARAEALVARRGAVLVIALRFTYGLRLAGAIALGMSRMPWLSFATLNLVGVLLWAPLMAAAGYVLGSAVEPFLQQTRGAEYAVFATILFLGVSLWLVRRARNRSSRL
jgi:membrane protein DedA with SNARE-associated domain